MTHKGFELAGEADNGIAALETIRTLQPDLVFLDLQIPGMSGFEVIRSIETSPLLIIVVVTAYDEYAVEAFEAATIDCLLKPVSEERLQRGRTRVFRVWLSFDREQEWSIPPTTTRPNPSPMNGRYGLNLL